MRPDADLSLHGQVRPLVELLERLKLQEATNPAIRAGLRRTPAIPGRAGQTLLPTDQPRALAATVADFVATLE